MSQKWATKVNKTHYFQQQKDLNIIICVYTSDSDLRVFEFKVFVNFNVAKLQLCNF